MERELVENHLRAVGMEQTQAEALSRLLAEQATKTQVRAVDERLTADMRALDERLTTQMRALDERLTTRMDALNETLCSRMDALKETVRADLHALETRITWRYYSGLILLAALLTLVDVFVD